MSKPNPHQLTIIDLTLDDETGLGSQARGQKRSAPSVISLGDCPSKRAHQSPYCVSDILVPQTPNNSESDADMPDPKSVRGTLLKVLRSLGHAVESLRRLEAARRDKIPEHMTHHLPEPIRPTVDKGKGKVKMEVLGSYPPSLCHRFGSIAGSGFSPSLPPALDLDFTSPKSSSTPKGPLVIKEFSLTNTSPRPVSKHPVNPQYRHPHVRGFSRGRLSKLRERLLAPDLRIHLRDVLNLSWINDEVLEMIVTQKSAMIIEFKISQHPELSVIHDFNPLDTETFTWSPHVSKAKQTSALRQAFLTRLAKSSMASTSGKTTDYLHSWVKKSGWSEQYMALLKKPDKPDTIHDSPSPIFPVGKESAVGLEQGRVSAAGNSSPSSFVKSLLQKK